MADPFTSTFVQVSPTFRHRITIEQVAQNQKKNTSDVQVKGWLYNDSNFHIWNEAAKVWRKIEGEDTHSPDNFDFNIPPHDHYVYISHTFTVKHNNTTGLKSVDFTVSYGDTGTAESDGPSTAGDHLDLDRIAQEPGPPGQPVCTNIKTTSVTVSWPPPSDNHGAHVTNYRLRRWNETHTKSITSTSSSLSRNVTGLTPGATYYFEVQAENRIGWGPYSGETLVDLSGGGAIRVNGQWRTAEAYIRVGGKWREGTPYVRVGGVWKQAK